MSCDNTFYKKVGSTLDYGINWASWLSDDTIASNEWIVPPGITVVSSGHNDTLAAITISGGTVGEINELISRITTAESKIECRSIHVKIIDGTC